MSVTGIVLYRAGAARNTRRYGGHRSMLKPFHDFALILHGDGAWEVRPL
jgi:hypothetical protein